MKRDDCMFKFFKREPKEKLDCLGVYDTKPYHYFVSNMAYAGDVKVYEDKKVKVFTRFYKGTIFVFTFVDDETDFQKESFGYAAMKEKIDAIINEEHTSVINFIVFKNNNEDTVRIAKEKIFNSKTEFNQTFVYDHERTRLKYYRPVPDFYKLYKHYVEALVFDLVIINLEMR